MTRLVLATDAHFAWLLGEGPALGFSAPVGGLDERSILIWVRSLTQRLIAAEVFASWLIVDRNEVVAMCSFKDPPGADCSVEFGYSVAPERRRRGYATSGVSLVCAEVRRAGLALELRAETSVDNLASQRVLERNGFARVGDRDDEEEGPLYLWAKALGTPDACFGQATAPGDDVY